MVANPVKGEFAFKALGETWTAVAGFLATCQIEEEFGRPAGAVITELLPARPIDAQADPAAAEAFAKTLSLLDIARLFKCVLTFEHPDIDDRTAKLIINDIGVQAAMGVIAQALNQAAAPAREADDARPTKASRPRRTGTR